jgi:hypothetical protein
MPDDLDAYLNPAPRRPKQPLDLIAQYESGNRNIHQNVVPPGGGYNPSVGRVTGPSSAQGPWQITNATWRRYAPRANAGQYRSAMEAPVEVQRQVAQTIFDNEGYAPWALYNARLRAVLRRGEGDQYQHAQQPTSDLDRYLEPPGQTPPAQRQNERPSPVNPPASPVESREPSVPNATAILDNLNREFRRGVRQVKRQAAQQQPAVTGSSSIGELRRMDEPEAARIQRLQAEEAQRAGQLAPTADYMGTLNQRQRNTRAAQIAARRASEERADELRRQQEQPELDRLTQQYRQEIREAARITPNYGPTQWFQEALHKGEAGLLELGAAAARPFSTDKANTIRLHAEAMQRAAVEEGADRNVVSRALQDATAGLISTAPELAAMSLGAPPIGVFAAGGGARTYGRGGNAKQVLGEAAKGATIGAAFELPVPSRITSVPLRAATKGATVGGATGAIELASGASPKDAASAAITNALFGAYGELKHGITPQRVEEVVAQVPESMRNNPQVRELIDKARQDVRQAIEEKRRGREIKTDSLPPSRDLRGQQMFEMVPEGEVVLPRGGVENYRPSGLQGEQRGTQTEVQPGVAQERAAVEPAAPTTETVSARSAVDRGNVETESVRGSEQEATAQRFFHRDFGEVVESLNQRRVGKGRVRVVAEDGSEHVIKRSAMTGAGNQRAVPIRPEPIGESTSEQPSSLLSTLKKTYDFTPASTGRLVVYEGEHQGEKLRVRLRFSRDGKEVTVNLGEPSSPGPDALDFSRRRSFGMSTMLGLKRFLGERYPAVERLHFQREGSTGGEVGRQRQLALRPTKPEASDLNQYLEPAESPAMASSPKSPPVTATESQLPQPKEVTTRATTESLEPAVPQTTVKAAERAGAGSSPSSTAVRNEAMAEDRAARDLPELVAAEPRRATEVHQRALEANRADPRSVERLVTQALETDKNLTDVETAQLRLRAQEIKNREGGLLKEINSATDPQTIGEKRAELDALTNEFDRLSQATRKSGTEWGRAGMARQQAIDQDFSLVAMKARLKAAKGDILSEQENAKVEELHARLAKAEADLADANDRLAQRDLQKQIDRVTRRRQRSETKESLDAEFARLITEFSKARKEIKNVQASGLAGLDPEGKLTKLVAQMARNRIKAGINSTEALVRELYETVKEHGWSREDVVSVIRQTVRESDDVLSRWDKTRQAQLLKREAELQRRLTEKDYSKLPPRERPIYNRETRRLGEQVQHLKNRFDLEMERAKPGHLWRQLSGIRKSWMLSGISTQAKNIGGTAGYQVFDELARFPAVIADAAVAPFTGRRSITQSPTAMLDSVLHAVRTGGREAGEIMRVGATKEQLERHQFSEIDTGVKLIDYTSNLVFRFMSASDRVFYNYALKRNFLDRALAQAKTEGAANPQQRAKELAEHPTEELDAAAKHDALVATFNNSNQLSEAIKRARSNFGSKANFAIDLVMPFDRTPTNVIARIIEASPAGAGKAAYQLAKAAINRSMTVEEQRQFSQTVGRATVGTAIMALGWSLADKLLDVEDYRVLLNIGGYRLDLTTISPVGNLIALGARMRKAYEKGSFADAAKAGLRVPLDQPLLRAGSEVTEVVRDPARSTARSGGRLASSFIPFGGLVRDIGKAIDPEERKAKTFKQQVQQNIPVWRQRLPVRPVRQKQLTTGTGRPNATRLTAASRPTSGQRP